MDLTLQQAADLLAVRPRTLRDQLRRGAIRGRKSDGRWIIRKADLPLTDADRRALQGKLAAFHDAIDRAVPPRIRGDVGLGSVEQLDVFVLVRDLHAEIGAAHPAAGAHLRAALFAIARGHHQFDRRVKLTAFDDARTALSAAVVELTLSDTTADRDAVARLEGEVLPRLAGLIRWAEALPERRERAA